MDALDLFQLGMKREVAPFIVGLCVVNLGPGESHIPNTMELDWPGWNGETDPMPYGDESIDTVLGFHFLEHLTTPGVVNVLRETERVLKIGGTAIFMVPHASQSMAYQDLDHKTFYTEDSFRLLFANAYYAKMRPVPWRLTIRTSFLMAVALRNLAVFVQLQKGY